MYRKIEISHKTIIFTVLFLGFLWFLYFIKDIIIQFFVALLLMVVLNPSISKIQKLKIPRVVSILVIYLVFILLVGLAVGSVLPPVVEQTTNFASALPKYLANLGLSFTFSQQIAGEIVSQIGNLPTQIIKLGTSLFSNILNVLVVLIISFYLLLVRGKLEEQLHPFLGEEKSSLVKRIFDLLEIRLGGWARGQVTLMLLVGASIYIGLLILGIPFALPLAILAGILEIIPYLGPVLAAVPAVIIGFGISPVMGFATAALALLVQQLENYLFVPKVMEKSVGVSPIITLLALSIGFKIAGILGVVLSVPIVITLHVLGQEYLTSKAKEAKNY